MGAERARGCFGGGRLTARARAAHAGGAGPWPRAAAAALVLAAADIAITLAAGDSGFLGAREIALYVVGALTAIVGCVLVVTALGALALRVLERAAKDERIVSRRILVSSAVAAAASGAAATWVLTGGRLASGMGARPWIVAGAALVAGALAGLVASSARRLWRRGSARARLAGVLCLTAIAVSLVGIDVTVLPRGYPLFHWALEALALAAIALAVAVAPAGDARPPWGFIVAAWACAGAAPFALLLLAGAANARFVVAERAPITGKLVRAVGAIAGTHGGRESRIVRARSRGDGPPDGATRLLVVGEGLDLRDRDLLLVTIDALRADRVQAYGGAGLTPSIDALAREGAVFRCAYTPTPHTSYAVASLHTGKFMRPLLELGSSPEHHATIAQILRRYGYRTAAFYPPAIFYVDTERFEPVHRDALGFEYRKEMFADGPERVRQLEEYLRDASRAPRAPLFVWVHLFEPHEPYEPPAGLARGASAPERYDGEVRAADRALGDLVRVFRGARPGATVIVSADHGEELGDHGGYYHGTTLYEEQIRVPLIWSSPGAVAPHVIDAPVELVDVATTILLAAGAPPPANMRGDDLTPLLRGGRGGPHYAFASLPGEWMITDGRYKAICAERDEPCRVYDLAADPRERRNVGPTLPAVEASLARALGAFIASIPRIESRSLGRAGETPEALARARLGDRTAAPEILPLLGADGPGIRAEAARALGELAHLPARAALARVVASDTSVTVREEAAISLLELGDEGVRAEVERIAREEAQDGGAPSGEARARRERAALALAAAGDAAGAPVLVALASDTSADIARRRAAIVALGRIRSASAARALVALLPDERLRIDASDALGAIGDRSARTRDALYAALSSETHPPARASEARALAALRDRRVEPLVRRYLGDATPVPGGVELLVALRALVRPSGGGADLRRSASARVGAWQCDDTGCAPGEAAAIALPARGAPAGAARLVAAIVVDADSGTLDVAGASQRVERGAHELAFSLPAATGARALPVRATAGIRIAAVAVVPASEH